MIEDVTKSIDDAFTSTNPNQMELLVAAFGITYPDVNHGDFMFYVADIFTMGVQYGDRTGMCAYLMANTSGAAT